MDLRLPHGRGYHEWARSTPVADAVACIVAFAGMIVAAYAILFLLAALRDGHRDVALHNAAILLSVGMLNLSVEVGRRWRRHHH
jgi:hypothetical protein